MPDHVVEGVIQNDGYSFQLARHEHLEGARQVLLRTFVEDFGYSELHPVWHNDALNLGAAYLEPRGAALFVATDGSGTVVATCAVAPWNRRHPEHPDWLHARYQEKRTAELRRCYTLAEHRRRGLQRELVEFARLWVIRSGMYEIVNLHTNTAVAGAEPFWRSLAYEMHDSRPCPHNTVHFELPLAWPVRGSSVAAAGLSPLTFQGEFR